MFFKNISSSHSSLSSSPLAFLPHSRHWLQCKGFSGVGVVLGSAGCKLRGYNRSVPLGGVPFKCFSSGSPPVQKKKIKKVTASATSKVKSKNDLLIANDKLKQILLSNNTSSSSSINTSNYTTELPLLYHNKKKRKDSSFLYFKFNQQSPLPDGFPPFENELDFFLFEDGVIVNWGGESIHNTSIMKHFFPETPGLENSEISVIDQVDEEIVAFDYGNTAEVNEKDDKLILTRDNTWWEQVTYSIALVRSVKLDELEVEAENALKKALKLQFHSSVKEKQQWKSFLSGDTTATPRAELAYLYNMSYNLTVKSRVMEPPSFLWEKPHSLHSLYEKTCAYLDIESRVAVVQKKIKLPLSYWTLENDHATSLIGWRLEKMIIWLIAIEIFFQILAKSEWWQDFSWEKFFGLPSPPKDTNKNSSVPPSLLDGYEIVEEKIEIIKQ